MRLFKQLEFIFRETDSLTRRLHRPPLPQGEGWGEGSSKRFRRSRDVDLESKARNLLRELGAAKLAREVRVEWNPRLKTAAGRADFRQKLISLNPLLRDVRAGLAFNREEIDRTLRHELAHLLAQFRVGRRRIAPHGPEWREACRDLGIADEARCHNLPFATKAYPARFVYRCPNCRQEFPRVRRIRRAIACLACCRKHNGGNFDARFRLRLCSGGL
jgi:predicted SprT family Zn-dependent metalloprotease